MSMRAVRKLGTAVIVVAALAAMLSGCVGPGTPEPGRTSAAASPTLVPPPPPEAEPGVMPTASPSALDDARITELTAMCPGALSAEALRMLPQYGADAVNFFANTGQCGDIGAVLAAGEYPRPFGSPLQYVDAPCPAGTLLTVWAHYDDDLIFGSPAIPQALAANHCVRTLYLTASDAGRGAQYGLNREAGLRAAYDAMRGASTPWESRTVLLTNGITLAMTRPTGDPRITLFFLRLPDGGLDANGFSATGHGSIPKLLDGLVPDIQRVGGGAPLVAVDLPAAVSQLYDAYAPQTVMTSLPDIAEGSRGDHPDHARTGNIIADMVDRGVVDPNRVIYAQGYPTGGRPANVQGDELARKLDAFVKYAAHDSVLTCSTPDTCRKLPRFGASLLRQYLTPHTAIVREGS